MLYPKKQEENRMAEQNIDNINENELNEEELKNASGGVFDFIKRFFSGKYDDAKDFRRGEQVYYVNGSKSTLVQIVNFDKSRKPVRYSVFDLKNPGKIFMVEEKDLYWKQV